MKSPKLTYSIGDLHGRLDLLESMWDLILQDVAARKAGQAGYAGLSMNDVGVVFTGDYCDRGPDTKGVIDFIMDKQRTFNVVALKGNHEDMMVDALRNPSSRYQWGSNGAQATLKSYDGIGGPGAYSSIPDDHEEWLTDLPTYLETDHHIFVHAGLLPGRALDDQFENHLMWVREPFLECPDAFFVKNHLGDVTKKHVVHGHTPWPYDRFREMHQHIRTNLDSGAFFTGILTGAVFVEGQEGPPEKYLQATVHGGRFSKEMPETVDTAERHLTAGLWGTG